MNWQTEGDRSGTAEAIAFADCCSLSRMNSPMRPRNTPTELFSTFLQFEADQYQGWVTDARLRRSMQRSLQNAAETTEGFWALYWHKLWQVQESPLAQQHLAAYLQEPCYWAAQKTAANFVSTQYTLADCFQMAIARLDKVLKGFNAAQGCSFKSYAAATCFSLIRESLRQRQEVDICSDWGLLRKLSQKRLVESLQNAGLPPETIARHLLVWSCFKALYVPTQASGTRQLPKPDRPTWEAIAQRYNRDRTQLTPPAPAATLEAIEASLLACARAARAYLYPAQVSINAAKPGQEGSEFLDDLPQAQTSLLAELIAEEEAQTRQHQRAAVGEVLTQALARLDQEAIAILELYYRQGLTQQQMASQLSTKQYTVSRRLTKAREMLLLALAKWSQDTLHRAATPDVLKTASLVLEEWLQTHYSHPQSSTFAAVE